MPRGLFIAFEGLDGSGKSLQAKKVHEELVRMGKKCVLTTEPTDKALGKHIRASIVEGSLDLSNMTLQILFTADRSDHVHKVIAPGIADGTIVITDRYYWSTLSYGHATGLNMDWLFTMNNVFPRPDITFWFKISPEVAAGRRKQRGLAPESFEDLSIQKRVDEAYKELESRYSYDGWCTIDADKPIDDVFKQVMDRVKKLLDDNK